MPAGRPTDYTKELADRICERLALGHSMRRVCKNDDMPGMSTIFRWLRENVEFRQQYEIAKDEAADLMVEEINEIADDSRNDYLIQLAEEVNEKPASEWTEDDIKILAIKHLPEHVQRSRLRVDARKWTASKLKPKKYGDKTILSGDVENPLTYQKIERTLLDGDTTDKDS